MLARIPIAPASFLTVRVHRIDLRPGVTGLCVGYEQGEWRGDHLVNHLMEWVPEFALRQSELEGIHSGTAVRLMSRAVKNLYQTDDPSRRGEFGELLLHVVIRQVFHSVPAISKLYFKDGPNETVKGFDAVHVVASDETLELWLGEVKFHDNISTAISHVVAELVQHTDRDYLRNEFSAITNKIDDNWHLSDRLKLLLDPNTSLDQVFQCICIPVLLTYDSTCISRFTHVCDEYEAAFREEIMKHYATFAGKDLPRSLKIHLFLMPLKSKAELRDKLHERLKTWQSIA